MAERERILIIFFSVMKPFMELLANDADMVVPLLLVSPLLLPVPRLLSSLSSFDRDVTMYIVLWWMEVFPFDFVGYSVSEFSTEMRQIFFSRNHASQKKGDEKKKEREGDEKKTKGEKGEEAKRTHWAEKAIISDERKLFFSQMIKRLEETQKRQEMVTKRIQVC
jgi:hypothetical protein